MKKSIQILLVLCLIIFYGCKKSESKKELKNKTIRAHTSNLENDSLKAKSKTEFYSLFNEGTIIEFTPKDLEKTTNPDVLDFKKKFDLYEEQHQLSEDFKIDNLSILVNNETFSESNHFVNSAWLNYFIQKYKIYNLNEIMNLAIENEDYNAVKIILNTGYIVSKEELIIASEAKENAIIKRKLNLENKGLDEHGDPTFYDDDKSKADLILQLLNKKYNYKILDKDGYTNLRDDTFKDAYIIGTVKTGEHIEIIENADQDWLYIKTPDNRKGYVHKSRIKAF